MIYFYTCGKELANSKKKNKNKKQEQIYSYEFDSEYIYAAFLQQYGIDLCKIEYFHWWKFKALFNSLNQNTKIVEIMGYRAMDCSKIKDKKERQRYLKLKQIYALPDMRTQEQKDADFASAF